MADVWIDDLDVHFAIERCCYIVDVVVETIVDDACVCHTSADTARRTSIGSSSARRDERDDDLVIRIVASDWLCEEGLDIATERLTDSDDIVLGDASFADKRAIGKRIACRPNDDSFCFGEFADRERCSRRDVGVVAHRCAIGVCCGCIESDGRATAWSDRSDALCRAIDESALSHPLCLRDESRKRRIAIVCDSDSADGRRLAGDLLVYRAACRDRLDDAPRVVWDAMTIAHQLTGIRRRCRIDPKIVVMLILIGLWCDRDGDRRK